MTPEEVLDAVMECGRAVLKDRRPNSSFDLDRAIGADGYMFDDWAKVRSLAEAIVDCVEERLGIPDEKIQLPPSYPSAPTLNGTLGKLLNDLAGRIQ